MIGSQAVDDFPDEEELQGKSQGHHDHEPRQAEQTHGARDQDRDASTKDVAGCSQEADADHGWYVIGYGEEHGVVWCVTADVIKNVIHVTGVVHLGVLAARGILKKKQSEDEEKEDVK